LLNQRDDLKKELDTLDVLTENMQKDIKAQEEKNENNLKIKDELQ
jgi:hypothetical protein